MTRRDAKRAEDIMTRRVYTLSPDASVESAAQALVRLGYSGAPVTDENGAVLGVFSEQDSLKVLAHAAYEGWPSGSVASHMTKHVETVAPKDDLSVISGRFAAGHHRRLLVVEDGRLLGLIARRDVVRALDRLLSPEQPPTVYEIFSGKR